MVICCFWYTFKTTKSPTSLACVQPDFKGGKVSLRIREQYRVLAIFWISWISVFKPTSYPGSYLWERPWLGLVTWLYKNRLGKGGGQSIKLHASTKNVTLQFNTRSRSEWSELYFVIFAIHRLKCLLIFVFCLLFNYKLKHFKMLSTQSSQQSYRKSQSPMLSRCFVSNRSVDSCYYFYIF
jgi:hypothetical protein